ncbi:nitrous oxide reductase family maturation protein NosD [Cytobacillus sp. IB215665]|uniref:nitrous oxide reductase family maturation protein NosD n=1 Tax=Cytobacillus sp. IB215665 TaxID=3097357 RepID=UPI002A0FEDD5|nr:nitrous oxide reductase family maturation protein NosD [Cytobacillus sp. IB215665]MDX8367420.1 nitrous oxide reductase family maturation protein NosD [Cytobacillus sp. IB215665]
MIKKMITFTLFISFTMFPIESNAQQDQLLVVTPDTSIQQVINKAPEGGKVVITKGVYVENIIIEKPIYLIAEEGVVLHGNNTGSVITINSPEVIVEGFHITQSGRDDNDAGIFVKSSNVTIKSNTFTDVHFGIYVEGNDNLIVNNFITSYPVHFAKRGNGVHLFSGNNNVVKENTINEVQDGVYIDFATNSKVIDNEITQSRYAVHFMYGEGGVVQGNYLVSNINGLMIMASERIHIYANTFAKQLSYHGYGALIYDSDNITLMDNKIIQNSNGIALQNARQCEVNHNAVAGNHVGISILANNEGCKITNNNFMGNVAQIKLITEEKGFYNNYWDDYRSFDLSGDGIGEIPYKTGSMYNEILSRQPYIQFYFESPAIKMWTTVESMVPSLSVANIVDPFPLVEPISISTETTEMHERNIAIGFIAILFLLISSFIFYIGRM